MVKCKTYFIHNFKKCLKPKVLFPYLHSHSRIKYWSCTIHVNIQRCSLVNSLFFWGDAVYLECNIIYTPVKQIQLLFCLRDTKSENWKTQIRTSPVTHRKALTILARIGERLISSQGSTFPSEVEQEVCDVSHFIQKDFMNRKAWVGDLGGGDTKIIYKLTK